MNIRNILAWVKTLSPEKKEEMAAKFDAGTLSELERTELMEHVLAAMKEVKQQVDEAKEILAGLHLQTGK